VENCRSAFSSVFFFPPTIGLFFKCQSLPLDFFCLYFPPPYFYVQASSSLKFSFVVSCTCLSPPLTFTQSGVSSSLHLSWLPSISFFLSSIIFDGTVPPPLPVSRTSLGFSLLARFPFPSCHFYFVSPIMEYVNFGVLL